MSIVMDRLRTETRDLHTKAEKHPFQASMVTGRISREDYTRWLEQMFLVHTALDGAIEHHRADHAFLQIITDRQLQVGYAREDLEYLGSSIDQIEATPATLALVEDIKSADALRILGFFYVLEGANNGNRFIVRALRHTLRLDGGGDRYLDPYGEEQPVIWAAFKEQMGEQTFSEAQVDALVASAARMFEGVIEISEDLHAAPEIVVRPQSMSNSAI